MAYRVKGAVAVVELDDGKPELGTGRRIYLDHGVGVPAEAKKAHVEHLLNVGLIESTDSVPADDDPDGPGGAPAKSATKDEWVAYAVSQGAAQADAEAQTKEQLIAEYGAS